VLQCDFRYCLFFVIVFESLLSFFAVVFVIITSFIIFSLLSVFVIVNVNRTGVVTCKQTKNIEDVF